jgi:hypothetical protein
MDVIKGSKESWIWHMTKIEGVPQDDETAHASLHAPWASRTFSDSG